MDTVNTRENISSYIYNLVHARTFDEYITAMRQLFTAFRAYRLKLNPEKCIFIASGAKFLGWIIDSNGFRADPECVKVIREMKPPTTRKELRNLIGRLVWIRQFLETKLYGSIRTDTFSQLLAPIHALNRDNIKFIWTDDSHRAFEKIKRRLSSPPVISFPDFSSLFTLMTDASDTACGAILMQEAHDGKKKIIAATLHTFNATERNWSTTEREAFTIKWAILKYDYFLNGRTFVIFMDHKSLIYLDQREFNNAKIRRWQEEISSYRFILKYIQGETNMWADMLSRSRDVNKTKC